MTCFLGVHPDLSLVCLCFMLKTFDTSSVSCCLQPVNHHVWSFFLELVFEMISPPFPVVRSLFHSIHFALIVACFVLFFTRKRSTRSSTCLCHPACVYAVIKDFGHWFIISLILRNGLCSLVEPMVKVRWVVQWMQVICVILELMKLKCLGLL